MTLNWSTGPPILLGMREAHANFAGAGRDRARQVHGVFARDHGLRNHVELIIAGVGVPVQKQALARSHPEESRRRRLSPRDR